MPKGQEKWRCIMDNIRRHKSQAVFREYKSASNYYDYDSMKTASSKL